MNKDKRYKNITTEGNIRWTKGDLIFFGIICLLFMSFVIWSIIKYNPHS